jgi:hypothetical protein
MSEAVVLAGVRRPFTRYGGTLSGIRTDDLLGMSLKGRLRNAWCSRVSLSQVGYLASIATQ